MPDLINDYWTKKPPIEGRPKLQNSDDYWSKLYAKQRKDRMLDAIEDYLQDNEVDARRAYEEILSCVEDVKQHHKAQYDKANEFYNLLLGHRECDPIGVECQNTLGVE